MLLYCRIGNIYRVQRYAGHGEWLLLFRMFEAGKGAEEFQLRFAEFLFADIGFFEGFLCFAASPFSAFAIDFVGEFGSLGRQFSE